MLLVICAVKDRQIGVYMTPFFVQSTGQAIRSFSDEINRAAQDNILYKHPDDFELFHLGTFDPEGCMFAVLPTADLLATGVSCKIRE